jgi:non-ribosomal peptide synthetase component F
MSRNRDLAAVSGVLVVGWLLLGYAVGYGTKYGMTTLESLIGWFFGVLVLVFIPLLLRNAARWTALGACIVGIIWVVTALLQMTMVPIEALYGPILSLVFAALFAYFSFAAYLEKKTLA